MRQFVQQNRAKKEQNRDNGQELGYPQVYLREERPEKALSDGIHKNDKDHQPGNIDADGNTKDTSYADSWADHLLLPYALVQHTDSAYLFQRMMSASVAFSGGPAHRPAIKLAYLCASVSSGAAALSSASRPSARTHFMPIKTRTNSNTSWLSVSPLLISCNAARTRGRGVVSKIAVVRRSTENGAS